MHFLWIASVVVTTTNSNPVYLYKHRETANQHVEPVSRLGLSVYDDIGYGILT